MKVLVMTSSPRRDGNSAALATAVMEGLRQAGDEVDTVHIPDVVSSFLRDCRQCRAADGRCTIDDGFHEAFTRSFLPCEGFIAATPIYWYGMSAQLKAFFDRIFCEVAASNPMSARAKSAILGRRVGLLVSSEETFPTVGAGVMHQMQEYCRYTRSTFVGVVHGHGNARGDIRRDPSDPIGRARRFGLAFSTAHASDYTLDSERGGKMWTRTEATCNDVTCGQPTGS